MYCLALSSIVYYTIRLHVSPPSEWRSNQHADGARVAELYVWLYHGWGRLRRTTRGCRYLNYVSSRCLHLSTARCTWSVLAMRRIRCNLLAMQRRWSLESLAHSSSLAHWWTLRIMQWQITTTSSSSSSTPYWHPQGFVATGIASWMAGSCVTVVRQPTICFAEVELQCSTDLNQLLQVLYWVVAKKNAG